MKTFLLILVLAVSGPSLRAQTAGTPGVINTTKSTSIGIVAGLLRCTLQTSNGGNNTSLYCYVGTTLVFNASATVFQVTDQPNGPCASYTLGPDSVTVLFWRPATGQPVQWQVAANGTSSTGTF